jgi:hypothetical protein
MITITIGDTLGGMSTITPVDDIICRNIYILSITPVFYFVIPPSVSQIVILKLIQDNFKF